MPAKKPMTKTEIIAHIAEKFELPKTTSKAVLEELAELAAKKTKTVGEFMIPGVGKLVKDKRKARKGRNPATGESIRIAAKTVVKMRVSKAFKDTVAPPKKK